MMNPSLRWLALGTSLLALSYAACGGSGGSGSSGAGTGGAGTGGSAGSQTGGTSSGGSTSGGTGGVGGSSGADAGCTTTITVSTSVPGAADCVPMPTGSPSDIACKQSCKGTAGPQAYYCPSPVVRPTDASGAALDGCERVIESSGSPSNTVCCAAACVELTTEGACLATGGKAVACASGVTPPGDCACLAGDCASGQSPYCCGASAGGGGAGGGGGTGGSGGAAGSGGSGGSGCGNIPSANCCSGTVLKECLFGKPSSFDCGSMGCGWDPGLGIYTCQKSGVDPSGVHPIACP